MAVADGLSNAQLAELLAREAEKSEGIRVRAFRRAARSAFLWPERAIDVLARGGELTELHGVGPFISQQLQSWIAKPPANVGTISALRRDFLTLADAKSLLATRSDWRKSLRGDLQMHTRWSDGSGTVEEMAISAEERGYEYIAITDHSKGLKIAGGINETALAKQGEEINEVNRSLGSRGSRLTVLRSIEMNLNPRGEGDMNAGALRRLDLVLGSFHSVLRVKEDQTSRYIAALRNRHVHILGHPRGRIYNYRLGLKADWPRVFAEAKRLDKALEVDCYPDRQDLNLSLLKLAANAGCRVSLGTDAHHPWQLEFIELGLAAALKAKIPVSRIVNFMPLDELRSWVRKLRSTNSR